MASLASIIEEAYESRHRITPTTACPELRDALLFTVRQLENGEIRVAEKHHDTWVVNEWIKKAILLLFRVQANQRIKDEHTRYFDKITLKFANWNKEMFAEHGIRVVPPAHARAGSYVGDNCVLMPCYVNIGAYIGTGCMIDTWATVGSCAQIGDHVHISGGVGIGGVLEPLQARPVIIEDHCFIGARSEIAEGMLIESGAVISMGVYLSPSTKIYNRMTGEVTYGKIPQGAVVVPGHLPSQDGTHGLYAAIIVKTVDERTRQKTSVNELLREFI